MNNTHVLKMNHKERLNKGYEEGPVFQVLAGDSQDPCLDKIEFEDLDVAECDYLMVSVPVTDTNGMPAGPGDLVILYPLDGGGVGVTLVSSPSELVEKLLVDSVETVPQTVE